MIATAKVRYLRMSPRKIRYVIDLVRKKPVPQAYAILENVSARACRVVKNLILQAATSAKKDSGKLPETLYISKITADGAGMMKRFRAMSMGRAGQIRKRLSHVVVELDERRVSLTGGGPSGSESSGAQTKRTWKQKLVGAERS